jgi:hypothetical protein
MPKNKKNSQTKRAREAKATSQNTAANQPSNVNNPPPNVPPPIELLPNQNLQNSAASAAALPLLQQINFTSTNANIDISHSEAMDTSHSVMPQASQPTLQRKSSLQQQNVNEDSDDDEEDFDINYISGKQPAGKSSTRQNVRQPSVLFVEQIQQPRHSNEVPINSEGYQQVVRRIKQRRGSINSSIQQVTVDNSEEAIQLAMDISGPVSPQALPYDLQIANQLNLINGLKHHLGTSVTSFTETNNMKVKLDDDQYEEIVALYLMDPNVSKDDWVTLMRTTNMIKYTLASLIDPDYEDISYHQTSTTGICQSDSMCQLEDRYNSTNKNEIQPMFRPDPNRMIQKDLDRKDRILNNLQHYATIPEIYNSPLFRNYINKAIDLLLKTFTGMDQLYLHQLDSVNDEKFT